MSGAALADRVAIVFGSATGIGAACARTLADRGAAVILADIAVEAAERIAAQIAASGGQAVVTRCDVTAEADVEARGPVSAGRQRGAFVSALVE